MASTASKKATKKTTAVRQSSKPAAGKGTATKKAAVKKSTVKKAGPVVKVNVKPAVTPAQKAARKVQLRPSAEEIKSHATTMHKELRARIAEMIKSAISPQVSLTQATKLGTRTNVAGSASAGGGHG